VRRVGVVALAFVLAACGTTIVPREPRVVALGGGLALEIVDETGELRDARAVTGEANRGLEMPLEGPIGAQAGSTLNEARIVWISTICETSAQLTISNPNKVTITPGPRGNCGDMGRVRAVDLVFRGPVNAAALQVELMGDGKG
jgi:hypothetical protein